MAEDRLEIVNGARRAVFVRAQDGWRPDWFYEGDRRMLRFKDHEWLSVGHIHPTAAETADRSGDKVAFRGTVLYGTVRVAWSVTVKPDRTGGGFMVESSFVPSGSIELMEAFTSFETPYEYDGSEHVTTAIGQNPITQWKGKERISPPQWSHPMWSYNRPEYVHMTGPCNAPLLVQSVCAADGSNARHTAIVGDWNVSACHDILATPTRTIPTAGADWSENARGLRRGYKYIVGAVNWSSSMAKDPNVMYKAGRRQRQRLFIAYASVLPSGRLDELLMAAWQRAAALDLPASGKLAAHELAVSRGATWQAAVQWLGEVFKGRATEGLFLPEKGIRTYAPGTRPKAGEDFSWHWWPLWAGYLHYRAMLTRDTELAAACERYDSRFAAQCELKHADTDIVNVTVIPALKWIAGAGKGGGLAAAMRGGVEASYGKSIVENGTPRAQDYGNQATRAEALLLAARAYDEPRYARQAAVLLDEINAQLDGKFWTFGGTSWADMSHGGQVRPLGYGHAIAANLRAWQRTGEEKYMTAARRFARLLVAVNFMTHDGSPALDFDWRGWAHGTTGGRDQHAQCPPLETSSALMCLTELMAEKDLEGGCYDAVWYFERTGLAQFPKARTYKRIWDPAMQTAKFVRRELLVSERDFYDCLPFLAYENPSDQTLLASYQGSDCLEGELVFGGGLARAGDGRVCVLVPHAAQMDPAVASRRVVKAWNPTARAIRTQVTVTWPDGSVDSQPLEVPPRQVATAEFERVTSESGRAVPGST